MVTLEWRRARIWVALWISARIMPWQVRRQSLNMVLRLAEPSDTCRYVGIPEAYISRAVERLTRHPWLMRDRRCLRRGLLGFRFLSEAGLKPELHFAIDARSLTADQLVAHCWVCVDGKPVVNERLQGMTSVFTHSGLSLTREQA